MKKAVFVILLLSVFAGQAFGDNSSLPFYEEVFQTSHNLIPKGPAPASVKNSCGYCHFSEETKGLIPSFSNTPEELAPLEKKLPEAGSSAMKALWSPSARIEFRKLPSDPAMACLVCHDGVLGADIHGRNPVTGKSIDHPVNVYYPRKTDGRFAPSLPLPNEFRYWSVPDKTESGVSLPTGPTSSYFHSNNPAVLDVRTYDGKVGCGSCHNPHTAQFPAYLRENPKTLCLVCHIR